MLETLEQGLALFMTFGVPILPYAGISLVIYYVMNLVVKPLIASHRDVDGYHQSALWMNLRRGYAVYPMILGFLASLALPHLIWGYCVVAGVCAQAWYFILYGLKAYLKKKGFSMPPAQAGLNKSMMLPPKDKK